MQPFCIYFFFLKKYYLRPFIGQNGPSGKYFVLLALHNLSSMSPFISEILGTAVLILLGNGVVANVVLRHTKGHNSGWIVISFGWAIAVFVGVFIAAEHSGAHLNPAVTLALAITGQFAWAKVPAYMLAQLMGAMMGAVLVWLSYKPHFDHTEDANAIQASFCTAPAIPHRLYNVITEIVGTFILVLGVLFIAAPGTSLGALDALPVALLVLALGLSLGGPTGYAINPARDLGPRIIHALLPIPHKNHSNWAYSWTPLIGPFTGSTLAALLFMAL
jgi:glycerol uptake facilitator protein